MPLLNPVLTLVNGAVGALVGNPFSLMSVQKDFSVQITGTSIDFSVTVQASLDGTHWFNVAGVSYEPVLFQIQNVPVAYIRAVVDYINDSGNVTVKVVGV